MPNKEDHQACRHLAQRGALGSTMYPLIWLIILWATPLHKQWPTVAVIAALLLTATAGARVLLNVCFDKVYSFSKTLWLRLYSAAVLVQALSWGVTAAITFWGYTTEWPSILVVFSTAGIVAGGTIGLSSHLQLQRNYLVATLLPSIAVAFLMGSTETIALGILFSFALLYLLHLGKHLHQQYWDLRHLSDRDGLTGIANRRYFDLLSEEEMTRAQRGSYPLSLLLIDIDHFKNYNDYYGHQRGDQCLQRVAQTLATTMRRSTDLAARYGGEEFVCILPMCTSEGAQNLSQQLLAAVQALQIPHQASATATHLTFSIGSVTIEPDCPLSAEDALKQADQLLYRSKSEGRNRFSHASSCEFVQL